MDLKDLASTVVLCRDTFRILYLAIENTSNQKTRCILDVVTPILPVEASVYTKKVQVTHGYEVVDSRRVVYNNEFKKTTTATVKLLNVK